MTGGSLALDLATVTGWAYAEPGSTPAPTALEIKSGHKPYIPKSGSIRLGDGAKDYVRKLVSLEGFLQDTFKIFKPSRVIFEAPFVGGKKSSQDMARLLMGMASTTEVQCYKAGIGPRYCFEANITQARKYFCGSAPRDRRIAKQLVQWRCNELHWDWTDDNAADALGVLDFFLGFMEPRGLLPQIESPIEF